MSDTIDNIHIDVAIGDQCLYLRQGETCLQHWPVSTARNGVGEQQDSECTPRGQHIIAEKIGDQAISNTVFVGRVPSGEIYTPLLAEQYPERDWILTRILWLAGCEAGKNQGGNVDTKKRYIYIHGCPEDTDFSTPGSHGCIRMRNADIIMLYDRIQVGTPVYIHP